MATTLVPPLIAGFVCAGILAASISSSDSYLLISASAISKNVWQGLIHKDAKDKEIMAEAVKRIRPEVKVAIGPAIENGWYYDFDTDKPFTREDLDAIEAEMKKVIKEGHVSDR